MNHFLFHRRSRPTGEVIARALGVDTVGEVIPYHTNLQLIRWGSRVSAPYNMKPVLELNKIKALTLASDKLGTLETLCEAGVQVPTWSENPEDLTYPFLGRKRHHARGSDVVLCLQRGDYRRKPRDYYIEYVPTVREFRIHVVRGDVIRIQAKFLDRPELASPWIRNYEHGYRFRAPRRRPHNHRLETAIKAVEALGLDFGAVDLLVGDDGETYVLEVNTAPACSPLTAGQYVRKFQEILGIPDERVVMEMLDILSPEQDDGDTEDPVEGEDDAANATEEGTSQNGEAPSEQVVEFVAGQSDADSYVLVTNS